MHGSPKCQLFDRYKIQDVNYLGFCMLFFLLVLGVRVIHQKHVKTKLEWQCIDVALICSHVNKILWLFGGLKASIQDNNTQFTKLG